MLNGNRGLEAVELIIVLYAHVYILEDRCLLSTSGKKKKKKKSVSVLRDKQYDHIL